MDRKNLIYNAMLSATLMLAVFSPITVAQQQQALPRLPAQVLDITAPSSRVIGAPGSMKIQQTSCQARPSAEIRRRIVNAATQEWAFFGFTVVDQTNVEEFAGNQVSTSSVPRVRRRLSRFSEEEVSRVADSIGGYWSATSEGGWILARQNDAWNGPLGLRSRWRDAWSAAFISWLMCEGGLDDKDQFQRAIAHHTYIDQAIRARDENDSEALFSAFDLGEMPVIPGDMLCRGSRPAYKSLDQRRLQLGVGARTHCDLVVKVDEINKQFLVIGGNVRGSVSLKIIPADNENNGPLKAAENGRRSMFAHLKLKTEAIENDAFDQSPTIRLAVCNSNRTPSSANIVMAETRELLAGVCRN